MIRFNKASANQIVVTLTENATIANPIFLFLFNNEQTNVNYYFIASDTSNYKERYNQFTVTEQANPNTLNGQISIGNEGFYNYTIFQTSLTTLIGLVTANDAIPFITKTLETGLVWVVPEVIVNPTYTPQTNTSIVYQPD